MSIGPGAADAVLQPARTQDSDPRLGEQGERCLGAPTEIPEARPAGAGDSASFAYIWQLFGYTILDRSGAKMGPITRVWTDTASGHLKFVGLATGRLRRQAHVIPAGDVHIDDHERSMTVAYRAATIRGAPCHNTDVSLKNDQERKVYAHYDNS
ncbi:MAG TPA: hypothetical protein VFB58_04515 [Chloroflexota bacterium]|nr:hypothetical protein [Chloroflexota bacterium]